jgi:hypothetical protein
MKTRGVIVLLLGMALLIVALRFALADTREVDRSDCIGRCAVTYR